MCTAGEDFRGGGIKRGESVKKDLSSIGEGALWVLKAHEDQRCELPFEVVGS